MKLLLEERENILWTSVRKISFALVLVLHS